MTDTKATYSAYIKDPSGAVHHVSIDVPSNDYIAVFEKDPIGASAFHKQTGDKVDAPVRIIRMYSTGC